jgi:hypothetical protein
MSFDEEFLAELVRALAAARLEAVVIGTAAAILQGAPLMTQDVDLLVRDTPRNRRKIANLCDELGVKPVELSDLADGLTLVGGRVPVDILFGHLPGRLRFEQVKAHCVRIPVGEATALVASLADVVRSKTAAGRPKDRAQLPTLRETLRVRKGLLGK